LSEIRAKDQQRIRLHPRFASRYLSTPRDIVVYLPPGYDSNSAACSILYLQDVQNLFDPQTAFGGQDWRVDVTADDLILPGASSR
jgi:predicted alpha/beta superfamily hydrolase